MKKNKSKTKKNKSKMKKNKSKMNKNKKSSIVKVTRKVVVRYI